MDSLIQISSGQLTAEIHPLGAQLFSLRDAAGRDLQWHGDPTIWKGRAPILFPIVGALAQGQYRLDGHSYCLSRHGFARDRVFDVVEAGPASALFRLNWDEETFRLYPFRFQFDLEFAVTEARLRMTATVRNLDEDTTLPASVGFHPALRWPLPYGELRAAHFLEFETDEPAPIRRLDAQGLLSPQSFATPVADRRLELRDDLFTADAIIFDKIASRRLSYGAKKGPRIEIEFPEMPYLGVWTKPGAGFICIEPWHGIADPAGFSGDFTAKPGIALLAPGTERTFAMSITLKRAP
jgi:galactose mutarotase-like enzyme